MKTSRLSFWSLGLLGLLAFTACQKSTSNEDGTPAPTPTPTPTPTPVATTEPAGGTGVAGAADGDLATAQFNQPKGIVLDAAGNIYVADHGNHRIRKITAAGQVSVLAGSSMGLTNGTGTAAKFNSPGDVDIDGQGNVYVADIDNNCIRKISPAGEVTTFAGSKTSGFVDATGAAARFDNPRGVAVDAAGNLYVADMNNHSIRKITPDGAVTTLAGSNTAGYAEGTGAAARFNQPRDVAVDGSGNVYVVDANNNCIRKITPAGVVSTLAGSQAAGYGDGAGTAAKFKAPKGICIAPDGVLYVADTDNNRIRKISAEGLVTTLAGDGTAGYAEGATASAKFNAPRGIALDKAGKILYIGDEANNRIRKIELK